MREDVLKLSKEISARMMCGLVCPLVKKVFDKIQVSQGFLYVFFCSVCSSSGIAW